MSADVLLSAAQRAAIARGGFLRVELGAGVPIGTLPGGAPIMARSALVGRGPSGVLRAYVNVCRHQAVPLDMVFDEDEEAAAGVAVPAPATDAGDALMCFRHGALYGLEDGVCTLGPCQGERLLRLEANDLDGDIRVKLRLLSG